MHQIPAVQVRVVRSVPRATDYLDVQRVVKKGTRQATRRRQIYVALGDQGIYSGDFRKSTIPSCFTTSGTDGTVEPGRIVGPKNYFAAVALCQRIGSHDRVRSNKSSLRVLDARVSALIITAHERNATTGVATYVDQS